MDPANPKRWWFSIRQGVQFHDGKLLTAADVAFSFDRAFRRDAAWFDSRANAAVSLRMPTIADWGAEGEDRFWLDTIYPDSTVPSAPSISASPTVAPGRRRGNPGTPI